jgi:hypothetical protein
METRGYERLDVAAIVRTAPASASQEEETEVPRAAANGSIIKKTAIITSVP